MFSALKPTDQDFEPETEHEFVKPEIHENLQNVQSHVQEETKKEVIPKEPEVVIEQKKVNEELTTPSKNQKVEQPKINFDDFFSSILQPEQPQKPAFTL